MRYAVVIGCAVLVLVVLAGRPVQAQTLQCTDHSYTADEYFFVQGGDHTGEIYTLIEPSDGMVLTVGYQDGDVFSEWLPANISYTIAKPVIEIHIEFGSDSLLRICSPVTSTPTATFTPTATSTTTAMPTVTPLPALPGMTDYDTPLDLLPEHGGAISESATGAGFPIVAALIWLIGWFGLLWLVRR